MTKKRFINKQIVGMMLIVVLFGSCCFSYNISAFAASDTYDEVTVYDLYDLTNSFSKTVTAPAQYMGEIPQQSAINTAVRYKIVISSPVDFYAHFYVNGFLSDKNNWVSSGGVSASITDWVFGLCKSDMPYAFDDNQRYDLLGFGVAVGKEYIIEIGVSKKYDSLGNHVANKYYVSITGDRIGPEGVSLGNDTITVQYEDTTKAEPGKHFFYFTTTALHGYSGTVTYSTSHDLQIDDEKGATCTEDGHTISVYCSDCGKVFIESQTIPAGHTVSNWIIVTPATCVENGLRQKKCVVCGEIVEQEVIQAHHTVVIDEAILANCTQTGLTEGSHCTVCGEVIIPQQTLPINPDVHIIVPTETAAPTCIEPGHYGGTHCAVCGRVFAPGMTLVALGHEFSDWEIDESFNIKQRHCLVCGYVETENITGDPQVEGRGCKSSVIGLGSLLAVLPLFACGMIWKNRRKKDESKF